MLLEVCVDSPLGLMAAIEGGADRVELCSALPLGGLTPTTTLMAQAKAAGMPAMVMIRPRPGDFVWAVDEVDHMQAEIVAALEMGMQGIVIGANRPDGRLDTKVLAALLKDVGPPVQKVLHRCIDLTPDPVQAVDTAIALGFDRILTSGGAQRAVDGLGTLQAMLDRARGRIEILPGSGITADNVAGLLAVLAVDQVHASCSAEFPQAARAVSMGFTPAVRRETDAGRVAALRRALKAPV